MCISCIAQSIAAEGDIVDESGRCERGERRNCEVEEAFASRRHSGHDLAARLCGPGALRNGHSRLDGPRREAIVRRSLSPASALAAFVGEMRTGLGPGGPRRRLATLLGFMADATTNLAVLKDLVRRFGDERQWQPFHTPKNLAMGLACETAELMEHFLWVDGPTSLALGQDPARREAIVDEVADVFAYVLNLGNVLEIDLSEALQAKVVKNAIKYPVER